MSQSQTLRDLGDGLTLRRSSPDDAEVLAEFNAQVHGDPDENFQEIYVAAWVRDLLTLPHPTFNPADFTIVEDTRSGKIVSSLNLISQTWTYAGIPFKVGRPELVGTDPAYRKRGLVRAQFDIIHQWSAERGELLQVIGGIPYYYRLFGYEMALNLGGGRAGYLAHVPELPKGKQEPYSLRPAFEADLPFIAETYAYGSQRHPVACQRDQALWRYELLGKSPDNATRFELRIIADTAGEPVGFLAHSTRRWDSMIAANYYELKPGVGWSAVTPSVIRYLQQTGQAIPPVRGDKPFDSFGFWLGEQHPVYQIIPERLPRLRKPYAWYLRLPDLAGFIRLVAPALENRLADSVLVGYSGELKITFYRDGLLLVFEQGRLIKVESYSPAPFGHSGQAAFPGLTFLQLLFGYRSLDEIKYAFADCWTNTDEAAVLLNILFPRQPSDLWPIA